MTNVQQPPAQRPPQEPERLDQGEGSAAARPRQLRVVLAEDAWVVEASGGSNRPGAGRWAAARPAIAAVDGALAAALTAFARPVQAVNGAGATHELIAGERRWRAAKAAGLAEIPTIVRADVSEMEAIELTVTENLQREDLHPLEEARGVAELLTMPGNDYRNVAARLGKSLGWVALRARIAKLSAAWRKLAADPKSLVSSWSGAHLALIARLEPAAQDRVLSDRTWLIDRNVPHLPDLARALAEFTQMLRLVPWALDDALLFPKAGACATCPKRSSLHPGLFDEDAGDGKNDRCLDAVCFDEKLERHMARRVTELEAKHGKNLVLLEEPGYVGKYAQRFVKGTNRKLVFSYLVRKVRAGAKGAKPAIVVVGQNAGAELWVSTKPERSSGGGRARREPGKMPQPSPLAERVEQLDRRRKAHVIEAFGKMLVKCRVPPAPEDTEALVALFGTSHRYDYSNYYDPHRGGSWRDFDKLRKTAVARHFALWAAVIPVLTGRLAVHSLDQVPRVWKEAKAIAGVLPYDLSGLELEAREALPEPKSWANEKAAAKARETSAPATPQKTSKAKPKRKPTPGRAAKATAAEAR